MKMKRMFRRNQIIITTLAIMIAAAGYLNYSGKEEVFGTEVYEAGAMEISEEDLWAENQAVSGPASEEAAGSGDASVSGEVSASGKAEVSASGEAAVSEEMKTAAAEEEPAEYPAEQPGEAVLTAGIGVAEYIAGVQLSREQVRARSKETLNEIIQNESVDAASREAAVKSMMELTQTAEKENAAETLLMARGFADPVVSITEGKVDVVINAASITDPERAQIEDIVKRKTETAAENIIITLLDLQN